MHPGPVLLAFLILLSSPAMATEIVCRNSAVSMKVTFLSFPNKPDRLIVKNNRMKSYKITGCSLFDNNHEESECSDLNPGKPNFNKHSLQIVHEYGLPSDTDEIVALIGKNEGDLRGVLLGEDFDETITFSNCEVRK